MCICYELLVKKREGGREKEGKKRGQKLKDKATLNGLQMFSHEYSWPGMRWWVCTVCFRPVDSSSMPTWLDWVCTRLKVPSFSHSMVPKHQQLQLELAYTRGEPGCVGFWRWYIHLLTLLAFQGCYFIAGFLTKLLAFKPHPSVSCDSSMG